MDWLAEAGVERYHVGLASDEVLHPRPCGESHVFPISGPQQAITPRFDRSVGGEPMIRTVLILAAGAARGITGLSPAASL